MNEVDPHKIIEQLEMVQDRLETISNHISQSYLVDDGKSSNDHGNLSGLASSIIEYRKFVGDIFDPVIFADPATNIMLYLYIDRTLGRQSTSGSCCLAAQVPRTTALRIMNLLSDRGLIEMYVLKADRRSTVVKITEAGFVKTGKCLEILHKSINARRTQATKNSLL